jgi:hypothetical protein
MTEPYQNPISVIDHDGMPQSMVVTTEIKSGESNTINEGDLVFWNSEARTLMAVTEKEDCKSGAGSFSSKGLVGIAVGSNKPEVYGGGTTLEPPMPAIPVICKAVVFLLGTTGDTYGHFDEVTAATSNAQKVAKSGVSAGNRVGFVIVDPPATARGYATPTVPETITGNNAQRIRVLLSPQFAPATVI